MRLVADRGNTSISNEDVIGSLMRSIASDCVSASRPFWSSSIWASASVGDKDFAIGMDGT